MNTDNDRRLRVQYPNALYHVTSRGVDKRDIFFNDDDRHAFFDRTEKTVQKFGWLVYAITLMTNHFHLFFRTPQANLSAGAQYLLGQYARSLNHRQRRSGHVFEGRFRCKVIENETYAWAVSRYVHLNPVPALASHPAHFAWSSYTGYCAANNRLPWVCYDEHLAAWTGEFGGAEHGYCDFVERSISSELQSPFAAAVDGWILGSTSFAEKIRRIVSPQSNEPVPMRTRQQPISLQTVVQAVCAQFGLSTMDLERKRSRHPGRAILAFLAQQKTSATLSEIANVLGLARADCVPNLTRKIDGASGGTHLQYLLVQVDKRLQ